MARAPVDLANAALTLLVRGAIRDPDGSSPEAINTKAHMTAAIEEVLEEYDWYPVRVVAPLVAASGVALRGWNYAYVVPSDMIKIWAVGDQASLISPDPTPEVYELGMSADPSRTDTYIFTNLAGAYIRYASSRGSLARATPLLFDLFARRLAIKCCMPLSKNANLLGRLEASYERQLSRVKTLFANTEPELTDVEFVPEAIRVRSE